MQLTKEREQSAFKTIGGFVNKFASPRLTKVVVSVGTGSGMKKSPERNKLVASRLATITGQKPALRAAKQSIASFKIRQGDPVGLSVTLRGARMYHFLDKLIHVAIPRTKDFRGLDPKAVDAMGNVTLGIKEHTIFPETADEDLRDVFSLAVTVVSTAKTKAEAVKFFTHLGIPFKK